MRNGANQNYQKDIQDQVSGKGIWDQPEHHTGILKCLRPRLRTRNGNELKLTDVIQSVVQDYQTQVIFMENESFIISELSQRQAEHPEVNFWDLKALYSALEKKVKESAKDDTKGRTKAHIKGGFYSTVPLLQVGVKQWLVALTHVVVEEFLLSYRVKRILTHQSMRFIEAVTGTTYDEFYHQIYRILVSSKRDEERMEREDVFHKVVIQILEKGSLLRTVDPSKYVCTAFAQEWNTHLAYKINKREKEKPVDVEQLEVVAFKRAWETERCPDYNDARRVRDILRSHFSEKVDLAIFDCLVEDDQNSREAIAEKVDCPPSRVVRLEKKARSLSRQLFGRDVLMPVRNSFGS